MLTTDNWIWHTPKQSGANDSGEACGWYRDPAGRDILLKQDTSTHFWFKKTIHHDKNIAEVVASQLLRLLTPSDPDSFADAFFVVHPKKAGEHVQLPDETGDTIYVASVAIGNRISETNDLYKDAYHAYMVAEEFKRFHKQLPPPKTIPRTRPRFAGTLNKEPMRTVMMSGRYQNIPRITAGALIADSPDAHFENLRTLTIPSSPHQKKIVRIDFGDALKNFDGQLHFQAVLRYPPLIGPTNHTNEIPNEVLINTEFADELEAFAHFPKAQLHTGIETIIDNVGLYYGQKPLAAFATHIGLDVPKNATHAQLLTQIKRFLFVNLCQRQAAAKDIALEIRTSLCFASLQGKATLTLEGNKTLEKLITANLEFYLARVKPLGKSFRFHKADQKGLINRRAYMALLRQKLCRLFPHSATDMLATFTHKQQQAFHLTFNSNNPKRLAGDHGILYLLKTLIGFPSQGNLYNWLEWTLGGFGLLTLAKNTVKFVLEYMPTFIQIAFGHLYEKCEMYLSKPPATRQPFKTFLAHVGTLLGLTLYYVAGFIRQITMRITSPFQALNHAFEFGRAAGLSLFPFAPRWSNAVAYCFVLASAALTVAAITAALIVLAPLTIDIVTIKRATLALVALFSTRAILKEVGKQVTARCSKPITHSNTPASASTTPLSVQLIQSKLAIPHHALLEEKNSAGESVVKLDEEKKEESAPLNQTTLTPSLRY